VPKTVTRGSALAAVSRQRGRQRAQVLEKLVLQRSASLHRHLHSAFVLATLCHRMLTGLIPIGCTLIIQNAFAAEIAVRSDKTVAARLEKSANSRPPSPDFYVDRSTVNSAANTPTQSRSNSPTNVSVFLSRLLCSCCAIVISTTQMVSSESRPNWERGRGFGVWVG
jgi:hypothetical protein